MFKLRRLFTPIFHALIHSLNKVCVIGIEGKGKGETNGINEKVDDENSMVLNCEYLV